MAIIDLTQSGGADFTPEAAKSIEKLLYGISWGGRFQDWAIDEDGDLEAVVWSQDGSWALSFYLKDWKAEGPGFRAGELQIQISKDPGVANQLTASAFYTGNIYINRDFTGMSGPVREITEAYYPDGGNLNISQNTFLTGQWELAKFTPDTAQTFLYIVAADDEITGSPLADRISSGAGNDIAYGKEGDDSFFDGIGKNRFYGGPGSDSFYVQPGTSAIKVKKKSKLLPTDTVLYASKKKGKKIFYVDNAYDILEDYERGSDRLYFKGDPNAYTYDVFNNGIGFFIGDKNLVAFAPALTEAQYLQVAGFESTW